MSIFRRRALLWWAALALALLGVGLTLAQRQSCQRGSQVSAAISRDHLALLAEASGLTPEEWLAQVSPAGLGYLLEGSRAADLTGAERFALPAFLAQADGAPAKDLTPVLVEDHTRTSMYLPEDLDPRTNRDPVVKALWLFPDYADRAVGEDPAEIENLLFRAVTDRGLRLLILTPFYDQEGALLSDPLIYSRCLSELGARLEKRGLTLGGAASPLYLDPLTGPSWRMALAGLAPALAGVWLILCLPPVSRLDDRRKKRLELVLLALAALAAAALALLLPDPAEKLLPLAAAVLLPCVGAVLIARWARQEPVWLSALPFGPAALVFGGITVGWSLLCGLTVSALMTTRPYLMGIAVFSGVKIALAGPLVLGFCLLVRALWNDLRGAGRVWLWLSVAAVGLMGLALAVRSGDLPGGISGAETALRNLLETWFYGRPRTKELLFAAPCLPLFLWSCRKKLAPLQLVCGMGVCLELVSVTNTFCHGVAGIAFSVIRSAQGAAVGWLLGLAAAGLLALLTRKKRA